MERARCDLADLRKRVPKLPDWLNGKSRPTLRQLEDFARATSTPLGYLFLAEPPEERLPIPHFRTLRDTHPERPSPDLLETVQAMQRRQEWLREYLIEEGQQPLPFVSSAGPADEPIGVAGEIRRVLGLREGWAAGHPTWTEALAELREKMEAAWILVAVNGIVGNNTHRKLDPEEFRGFVLVDQYAPLVFVNGADAKAAQMFTLAHELSHLWLGSSAAFDLRELQPADDETERACNRIAAEFLVPERELRECWRAVDQESEKFQAIARRFKVSELVAARRAQDLGLISRLQFNDFYQRYLQDERRKASKRSSGGDFYATQNLRLGRRFAGAVFRAAREGRLFYREAYQLTGLSGKAFDRYAESVSLGGAK
jgi:Zn-dependent peptidase ImmA (M78 family)